MKYTKEEAVALLQTQTVTSLKSKGFFKNLWNTMTNVARTLNVATLWCSVAVEKEIVDDLFKENKIE